MSRIVKIAWFVLLAVCVGYIFWGYGKLPDRVAVHFNEAGVADNWMESRVFLMWFLVLVGGLNVWFLVLMWGMVKIPLALLSVPWKSYWLEHKEQMYDRLRGIVGGSAVFTNLVFLLCWHLVLQENGVAVPFEVSFFASTVGILVLIGVLVGGIFLALKPSR